MVTIVVMLSIAMTMNSVSVMLSAQTVMSPNKTGTGNTTLGNTTGNMTKGNTSSSLPTPVGPPGP